ERLTGSQEVSGSTPLFSTSNPADYLCGVFLFRDVERPDAIGKVSGSTPDFIGMKKDDEIRDFNLSNIRYSPQATLQVISVFFLFCGHLNSRFILHQPLNGLRNRKMIIP
ncbi:hypothetical protein, partial [Salinivirga cyanobacteriivorans]